MPSPEAVKAADGFDPVLHMHATFKAFMETSGECADRGYLVFIGPDKEGTWPQQLFVVRATSLTAAGYTIRKDGE